MKERNLVGEMNKRRRHPSSAPRDAVVAPNTLGRAVNVPQPNRWDNAVVESFFGTLKRELIHRDTFYGVKGAFQVDGSWDVLEDLNDRRAL